MFIFTAKPNALKKEIQQHIIEKQNIVLNIDGNISNSDLKTMQQEIAHLYKTKIGEILDKLFTEMVPADVHIKLDKLDIELPRIDIADFKNINDLVRAFEKEFRVVAAKVLKEKILKASGGKLESSGTGLKLSKWNILENFLEDGHYPSWASTRNEPIEKIFEELMNKSPLKVAKMVAELGRKNRSKLIDRIVYQFRGKYVDRLLSLLYQKHGKVALKLVESIRRRLGQRYQAMRGQKSVHKAIMSAAFDYVLTQSSGGKKLKYNEKELTQYIVEAIQNKYRHVDESDVSGESSGVKSEFKSEHSELDVLEYFLSNGSVPYWASTESRQSVQELFSRLTQKKLVGMQRMVEKYLNDDAFMRRLVMQFTQNQIFQLIEPMTEDIRRFLEGLINEFDKSGIETFVLKRTVLELMISRRGKFSKEAVTKTVIEKTAAALKKNVEELSSTLLEDIQERTEREYDLTRNELQRILKEILPDAEKKSSSKQQKSGALRERETQLLKELRDIRQRLERASTEEAKTLKGQRKLLRSALSQLREEMQKHGIAAAETVAAIAEKRAELERLLAKIQKEQHSNAQKEAEKLKKELENLSKDFDKLYIRLLRRFDRAELAVERLKLKPEFEKALALFGRERSRLLTALAEIENNLGLPLEENQKQLFRNQEKALGESLKKLEDKITKAEQLTESIKSESEEKKDEEVSENSKLDFLIFFLQYGSIPWWAEAYRESSVEDIFKEFAEKESEKLRQAFQRVGRNPVVWQRLVNQLSEEVLEKVLITLFPNFAGFAVSMAMMLQKIYEAKILKSLDAVSLKYFKWSKVTETLFTLTSALNPQNFIKTIVNEIGKELNISPSTLLEYISNLSDNNPGTRLSIFADIVRPIIGDSEILEVEKELLETAFKRRQEEEGLVIPEDKKFDVLSDYILKGIFADITYRAGYGNSQGMEKLLLELMLSQPDAIQKLLEKAIKQPAVRRRLSFDLSERAFWEIILLTGPRTLPLAKKYIQDLGIALGDNRMAVARDALLKYILQSVDKPFVMSEFIQILLKDAAQVSQRQRIAIINEWKRKVYQAPSYSSSLILALMQAEMQDLKEQAENTTDPSEKENLKDQMHFLQMEYQQLSQRLINILQREQPMMQGEVEIPEDSGALYRQIDETTKEIETLKATLAEKPTGEELLKQIMTQKQIAILEGQLEILSAHEPLSIRQLQEQIDELTADLQKEESTLLQLPIFKIPELPAAPAQEELEQLSEDMESNYKGLKERVKNLPLSERSEWVDLAAELGWEDLLKDWGEKEPTDDFLKKMPKLSLKELTEAWNALDDKNSYLQKRLAGRIRTMIAKTMQQLKKEQRELEKNILNAETEEKADELRAGLLSVELSQNDAVNPFFSAPIDTNLRQQLMRIRNNIRLRFQRLRAAADRRKAELADEKRKGLTEIIQKKKIEKENLEQNIKAIKEELGTGKKPKEQKLKEQKPEKKKKAEKAVDEPLFVRNAGLVILHPYYNRLFTTLNLVVKNKFVNVEAQIRAVHLLQFIATGKTEHPENELVLNKIICGLPLDTPVPMDVGLTEDELRVASGLLSGAIANWPRMKTMSPDSLRGTFILREGTIKEESDRWKLFVEKGSFDIMLKTIPWAFTFVRMGWMPKFIMVEWPLPG
jgi:hypothetical protein